MILMSVDVESWVHRPIFGIPEEYQTKELDGGHLIKACRMILDLFSRYGTKATFFILGSVAEWYPEIIDEIKAAGHEIGVHGYSHTTLWCHSRESFDKELKKVISVLGSKGVKPKGYRAPRFSAADFMYDVLKNNDISYDASFTPNRIVDGSYDCRPFLSRNGVKVVPRSVSGFSAFKLPVGGFYLRLFGARANRRMLENLEKRHGVAVLYFHPWEILEIPKTIDLVPGKRLNLSLAKKALAYYRIPMLDRVEYLLSKIKFRNFSEAIGTIHERLLG